MKAKVVEALMIISAAAGPRPVLMAWLMVAWSATEVWKSVKR